jgi:Zn-dependent membrane protease YugP
VVGITIFGGFIAAAFLLMAMALVKRVHPTPYYQTFICHESSESAAQTRVLKSIMQDNNAKDVFIDPSSEIAVAEHFDVAKCKTDRFVIYLTRGALRNTRCAGEIVLAHKSGKEIQVVQMPDFIHPTKEQLDNIEQYFT